MLLNLLVASTGHLLYIYYLQFLKAYSIIEKVKMSERGRELLQAVGRGGAEFAGESSEGRGGNRV